MHPASAPDARALAALYDEGYYHGVNSGYPVTGYEHEHPSFAHWIRHLRDTYGPGCRWLDLGCAYGYLVHDARTASLAACGIDVSPYALGQAPAEALAARGHLARGLVEALPFADGRFDVVSAFDVLEHLGNPGAALAEAHRVLRAGGAFIAATPDPCVFTRDEPTHVSERPPAYWIDRLLALGFVVDFRFFQAPFNLELLAVRGGGPRLERAARLRADGFGTEADVGTVSGGAAGRVALRLRSPWGAAGGSHPGTVRWIGAGESLVYVLVAGREPVRLAVDLEVSAAEGTAELTLALDDQQLGRAALDGDWCRLEMAPVPVAAGGHQLRLRASAPVLVRMLGLTAETVAREELLSRLPFDLYQRYDQCRAVIGALPGDGARSVLDVGGVLGGDGGHLATTADFFPSLPPPRTVDVRACDHPDHEPLAGATLPFADASFDVVLCQDVLEHVAPGERTRLLSELARVSRRFVLLAAPFATPGVAEADAWLFDRIRTRHGYTHRFLAEHLAHGHPDLAETVAFWQARDASVVVLPNGYLPYWSVMQAANLRLATPAMGERYAAGQRRYNGTIFDWREPAYRHLLVIDQSGECGWCGAVERLTADAGPEIAAAVLTAVVADALNAEDGTSRATEPAGDRRRRAV